MEFMHSKELFLNLIVEYLKGIRIVNCEQSIRCACQFDVGINSPFTCGAKLTIDKKISFLILYQ